jgi:hypothetical protein
VFYLVIFYTRLVVQPLPDGEDRLDLMWCRGILELTRCTHAVALPFSDYDDLIQALSRADNTMVDICRRFGCLQSVLRKPNEMRGEASAYSERNRASTRSPNRVNFKRRLTRHLGEKLGEYGECDRCTQCLSFGEAVLISIRRKSPSS